MKSLHCAAITTSVRFMGVVWIVAVSLMHLARGAYAQSPLPQPDLDLWRGGEVHASVKLPDGSVIVGGTFTALGGVAVTNIAKIRSDGTVDPSWAPVLPGFANQITPPPWSSFFGDPVVAALATDGEDAVYAGGTISGVTGLPSGLLVVKISASTGVVDTTFRARFTSNVYALSVDSNGIYVGGAFSQAGASSATMLPRSRLAKLSRSTGSVDASWNPGANGAINALALDGLGGLIVGGSFSTLGGVPRANLGRVFVDGIGGADTAWIANADRQVRALLVVADALYVGGDYFNIGGASRIFLSKLALNGGVDIGWANSSIGGIGVTALATDGASLYVARDGIAGSTMRIDQYPTGGSGAPSPNWSIQVDAPPRTLSASGSMITIGGEFDRAAAQLRAGVARVDAAALLQPELSAELPGVVYAFAQQSDGGVLVGGWFRRAGTQVRRSLLKLTSTGELDPSWQMGVDGVVCALSAGLTGTYVAGEFVEGSRAKLARISPGGQWDSGWNVGVVGTRLLALTLDEAAGALFVGGDFTGIGGQARSRVAKLSTSDGSAITSWNPGASNTVRHLALDSDGALYLAGFFSSAGGASRQGLAKLSAADGSLAPWDPSANVASFEALAVSSEGVFVGGGFEMIGGLSRSGLARLDPVTGGASSAFNAADATGTYALALSGGELLVGRFNGGLEKRDAATGGLRPWQPGTNGTVYVLHRLPPNEVLAGGQFTQAGGQPRRSLAKFSTLDPEHVFASGFEF